ncbi:GntR family transcriptional regulator [Actinomadura sp. WMMB 499]|uniref:GntR family transcriptional regulator n=1 Tax=Actinomadura sp. WMMB 499 TaxID=1219491 RepID=UPI0012452018|nr:GntR family transcriptional regulator [Actinomadura sp. WMMB 499]QFG25411.1 GntR family transcriptional regulator [Actinomadura sp. WMMB 499]
MGLSARDLAAVLRRKIQDQEFKYGETLPSQSELAREYGISVSSVNRSLAELRREGLVRPEQGKGTIVTSLPRIIRDARDRYTTPKRNENRGAFAAEVSRLGMTPRSDTNIFRTPPPARVAEFLGTPSGEEVVVRNREMYADDTLVQIAPSYIPLDIAGGTMLEDFVQVPGGMVSTMAELGFEQVHADEFLTPSRTPTPEEAEKFDIRGDQSVFEMFHVAYDATGRVVEVCHHVGPTHLWEFVYRVPMK